MKFEKSLERLEEIKELLEQNEISLDESIKLYSESVEHAKQCIEALKDIEGKITAIKAEIDKIIEQPLDVKED